MALLTVQFDSVADHAMPLARWVDWMLWRWSPWHLRAVHEEANRLLTSAIEQSRNANRRAARAEERLGEVTAARDCLQRSYTQALKDLKLGKQGIWTALDRAVHEID